jgi:hypothetical protein
VVLCVFVVVVAARQVGDGFCIPLSPVLVGWSGCDVSLYVYAGIWESLSSVVAGSCAGWVMWVVATR